MEFFFSYKTIDRLLIISFEGDLLGLNEEKAVLEVVDVHIKQNYLKCILDLSGVHHMNSTGLSYIIRIFNRFNDVGGNISMVKPPINVFKLIEITKLDQIYHFVDSYKEGLSDIK